MTSAQMADRISGKVRSETDQKAVDVPSLFKSSCLYSLATLAPHIAKHWDYAENDPTPSHYTWKSKKVVSWKCHVYSHRWDVGIGGRVYYSTGCPECYDARCGYKEDGTRTSNPSLAATSHPIMLQYDYDINALAGLDPAKIKCCSNKKVHWICHNCPRDKCIGGQ